MPLTPSLAFLSCPTLALPRRASVLALAGAISALMAGPAGAEDLLSLYQASRVHDATFLAAQAQAQAAQYKADQAKALVRPSLNLQAGITRGQPRLDLGHAVGGDLCAGFSDERLGAFGDGHVVSPVVTELSMSLQRRGYADRVFQ